MNKKHFRSTVVLPLPQGLVSPNMRLEPNQIFTVEGDALSAFGRFLANRERAGDLKEVDEAEAAAYRARIEAEEKAKREADEAAAKADADAKATTSPNPASTSKRATRDGDKESGR